MSEALFTTARSKMLNLYKKAGQEFVANTRPYNSTRILTFNVVNPGIAPAGGRPFAYAVARANQVLEYFGYAIGDPWTPAGTALLRATEAETNLGKARSTNGAADFVIEGVGFHCRSSLVNALNVTTQPGGQVDFTNMFTAGQTLDSDVALALAASAPLCDPGGIISSPQVYSPFNLENALMQAVIGNMSLEFEWDRRRTEKITVVDMLPQAGASSYLRANGEPCSANRYRIPEGYLWRRDGQADSEFVARVILQRPIVVPIDLPVLPVTGGVFTPSAVGLELSMQLYGLEVSLPSSN